ncbi:MAG: GGDEF domain-containing protein [Candidatus Omnitrophica bacterium]|nr:GGDEF domain-containing protein [Candidatus Omnitrophota bacterium]
MTMLIINLLVFLLLSFILHFGLKKKISARLAAINVSYHDALSEKDILTADLAILEGESSRLKHGLEETVGLYEITREISKFLDKDKVFEVFNEKIKRFLFLQDCRFLKADDDLSKYSDWIVFPLEINKRSLGSLAVKGIKEKDLEKFHILVQQFLLGLKRAVLYQHVQEMATLDGLTQVFTRRYWFQRSEEELERSRKFQYSFSCLMIDVDKFKDFNDTYGHLVGDAILAAVARVIKENIRQIDLLGKYGGEEFCVILTETDIQGAQFVAERIRSAAQDAVVQAYDEVLSVTISIGISGFPNDGADLTGLVDKADQALYQAKETGRNRVCVFKS